MQDRRHRYASFLIVAAVLQFLLWLAPPSLAGQESIRLRDLQQGGLVILLRHGTVVPREEPELVPLDISDCTVQGMLSDQGRADAVAIGEAFRALAIPVGEVLASEYCRTWETALLAFGQAEAAEALLGADYEPVPGVPVPASLSERLEAVRRLLATPVPPGVNRVLVTHGQVIQGSVGFDLGMGEAAIFLPGKGDYTLLARVAPSQWRSLEP